MRPARAHQHRNCCCMWAAHARPCPPYVWSTGRVDMRTAPAISLSYIPSEQCPVKRSSLKGIQASWTGVYASPKSSESRTLMLRKPSHEMRGLRQPKLSALMAVKAVIPRKTTNPSDGARMTSSTSAAIRSRIARLSGSTIQASPCATTMISVLFGCSKTAVQAVVPPMKLPVHDSDCCGWKRTTNPSRCVLTVNCEVDRSWAICRQSGQDFKTHTLSAPRAEGRIAFAARPSQ
jgi:hypothetical protein